MSPAGQPRGTLFIVGTPIGNLQDLTLRAVETLKQVAVVAAEDTRRTRALLSHLGCSGKRVLAVDAHASGARLEQLMAALEAGQDVALVTDAGMPSVSDPGSAALRLARERDIHVDVIPGPSAVTAAVALSGLVEGPFLFLAFLPRKGRKRRDALDRIAACADPVVLFEAPNRVAATLLELAQQQPERAACVCRELTKLHQEARHGSLRDLSEATGLDRGEITIVLGPAGDAEVPVADADLEPEIDSLLHDGHSVRDIAKMLSERTGRGRRELFQLTLARREASERQGEG
ncbi:MAG: 16S rRNA (cytidine(1402)-2'-O)-methyltransferase [Polyangiaceae bacterium]